MTEKYPCGGLLCNGRECSLVATLRNQAETNLTSINISGNPEAIMSQSAFFSFLQRIKAVIPQCCQPELAQSVLQEITNQATEFYSQRNTSE